MVPIDTCVHITSVVTCAGQPIDPREIGISQVCMTSAVMSRLAGILPSSQVFSVSFLTHSAVVNWRTGIVLIEIILEIACCKNDSDSNSVIRIYLPSSKYKK